MNNEFINLKDQLALGQVKEYLLEHSIHGEVIDAGEGVPNNLYLGQLPGSGTVNIMYVPLPEDHFEEIRLMQFYAPVVSEVAPSKKDDLLTLLNGVNFVCPLGSFSISDKNELGFKYIFPVNRFELPSEQAFTDLFLLYLDCLDNFKTALNELNDGNLDLNAALTSLSDSD